MTLPNYQTGLLTLIIPLLISCGGGGGELGPLKFLRSLHPLTSQQLLVTMDLFLPQWFRLTRVRLLHSQ